MWNSCDSQPRRARSHTFLVKKIVQFFSMIFVRNKKKTYLSRPSSLRFLKRVFLCEGLGRSLCCLGDVASSELRAPLFMAASERGTLMLALHDVAGSLLPVDPVDVPDENTLLEYWLCNRSQIYETVKGYYLFGCLFFFLIFLMSQLLKEIWMININIVIIVGSFKQRED